MDSIAERFWQADVTSLPERIVEIEAAELEGLDPARANIRRASAYYSFSSGRQGLLGKLHGLWCFVRARRCISNAFHQVIPTYELSHGECDIVGTLLLRRWTLLFIRSKPKVAVGYFDIGLNQRGIPPHSQALMEIGRAEAFLLLGQKDAARRRISAALVLERKVLEEGNKEGAYPQLSRVLRRAMALSWGLDGPYKAESLYRRAQELAEDPRYGSRGQREKLLQAWERLNNPSRWHRFLPS